MMIKTYKHKFTIKFNRVPDGFYGPVLRGGIGSHLKSFLSPSEYEAVFNTPSDGTIMKKYPEVPKGYVIDVPYRNSRVIDFSLILFEKTEKYFDAFLKAIFKTAARNELEIVYTGMDIILDGRSMGNDAEISNKLVIAYETPTYIQYKGELWQEPELHILVRNIVRRGAMLSYYYSYTDSSALNFDKSVVNIAERVKIRHHDCEPVRILRYSARAKQKMPMKGLIGEAVYLLPSDLTAKDKARLYEILKSGESFHVGKNTVFGYGKISVKYKEVKDESYI